MELLWHDFVKALHNNVEKNNFEHLQYATSYMEQFETYTTVTEKQKKIIENLLLLTLNEEKSIVEFYRYFPFVFSIEKVHQAIETHQSITQLVNTIETKSIDEQIIACYHQNEIEPFIFDYMKINNGSLDSLLYILSFAYLANEDKETFVEQRAQLFRIYQAMFSAKRVSLPKEWFLTTDSTVINQYGAIIEQVEKNKILNLAYVITSYLEKQSLAEYVETVKDVYEKLRVLFIVLSTTLKEGRVCSHD